MTSALGPQYRFFVFDFDGTLVDSQAVIVQAMTDAFAAADLPAPPAQAVRRVVGLTLEAAVGQLLPAQPWNQVQRVAELYREAYWVMREQPDHEEPLYPGAREALAALDGSDALLGIATGKGRRGLLASLERHGIARHFVTLQTPDDAPGKPHPAMVRRAMAEVGCDPDETVVIGDTVFDIEMARNAGVAALGVSWGYHDAAELLAAGAARVIDRFAELVPTLRAMEAEP